jgi:hypothetical protein
VSHPRSAARRFACQRGHISDCGLGMKVSSSSVQIQRAKYSAAVRASAAIVESRSVQPGHCGAPKPVHPRTNVLSPVADCVYATFMLVWAAFQRHSRELTCGTRKRRASTHTR